MPSRPEVSRREVVAGAGAVVLFGAVAAESEQVRALAEDAEDSLLPAARIGRLVLHNRDTVPHEFRVTIEVGGDRAYDEGRTVAAGDAVTIEDGLPADRGRVDLTATLTDVTGGDARTTGTFEEQACWGVEVDYSRQYGLTLVTGADICA